MYGMVLSHIRMVCMVPGTIAYVPVCTTVVVKTKEALAENIDDDDDGGAFREG